jgi:hydrogenase maturation protease
MGTNSTCRDAGHRQGVHRGHAAAPAGRAVMRCHALVAGIGNVLFGDDGFGVEVALRLGTKALPPGVRVVNVGLRPMHLAYELLAPVDLLLVVDAVSCGRAPGTLYCFEPDPLYRVCPGGDDWVVQGFDLSSALALASYWGARLPLVRILGCEPCALAGMCLSQPVWQAIEPAIEAILQLVEPRAFAQRARIPPDA